MGISRKDAKMQRRELWGEWPNEGKGTGQGDRQEWHSDKPFLLGRAVAVSVGDDAHFEAGAVEELVGFGAKHCVGELVLGFWGCGWRSGGRRRSGF